MNVILFRERRADAAKRPIGFGDKFCVLVNGNDWVKEIEREGTLTCCRIESIE